MPHEHHRALLAYLPSPHAIGCDSSGCCSTILTKQHRSLHLLARIAASTTNGEDVAHHRDLTSPLGTVPMSRQRRVVITAPIIALGAKCPRARIKVCSHLSQIFPRRYHLLPKLWLKYALYPPQQVQMLLITFIKLLYKKTLIKHLHTSCPLFVLQR